MQKRFKMIFIVSIIIEMKKSSAAMSRSPVWLLPPLAFWCNASGPTHTLQPQGLFLVWIRQENMFIHRLDFLRSNGFWYTALQFLKQDGGAKEVFKKIMVSIITEMKKNFSCHVKFTCLSPASTCPLVPAPAHTLKMQGLFFRVGPLMRMICSSLPGSLQDLWLLIYCSAAHPLACRNLSSWVYKELSTVL